MEDRIYEAEEYTPCKMDYYTERRRRKNYLDVADQCTKGILVLWDAYTLDMNGFEGNIFNYQFEDSDSIVKQEYLYAMDYLSNVLTAYKKTGKEIYKCTFEEIIEQFHEYVSSYGAVYKELPVYAQILLIIKALDIMGSIPFQKDFLALLRKYADWLLDECHYESDNNHGMFQNIALLHLSVLFGNYPEAAAWQKKATDRIYSLFENTYYSDYTNNENSIMYFEYNNQLYKKAISFCRHYGIRDIEKITGKLKHSQEAFTVFAHCDRSFPLIGDGRIVSSKESDQESRLFPDIGIAVLKVEKLYLSFKCKTVYQSHAHTDVSSITARYKNIDFLIDTGQYNYDRYTPINRYVRSAAGHSAIFPLFADNLFQKDFCDFLQYAGITDYEYSGDNALVKGEYRLKDTAVCREISVFAEEITIKDSWHSERPAVMRQRFVIPKELIEKATFSVSERVLESKAGNATFRFEIITDLPDALTVVQFGVAAPQYNAYEETMLLDTFVENAASGEITAKITIREDE